MLRWSLLIIFLASLSLTVGVPQPTTTMYVQSNGYANVVQYMNITAFTPTNVSLVAQPVALTVTYGDGQPATYQVQDTTLELLSTQNTTVDIEYSTFSIIYKNPIAWTVNFSAPYQVHLFLPVNSSLIAINHVPSRIFIVNDTLGMDLQPGNWSISYLPGLAPVRPSRPSYLPYILAAAVAVVMAVIIAFLKLRKKKKAAYQQANQTGKQVIDFLRKNGGSALESEIRRSLLLPKTTEWRAVKRLEREGIIRIERVNKENRVTLVR